MRCKWVMVAMIAGLCACAQGDMLTCRIAGTGSGALDGVPFVGKMFQWELTYDTTNYTLPWGEGAPLFLDAVSVITLQGEAAPIQVTQEHGLFVNKTWFGHFQVAPIQVTGYTPKANILTVGGEPFWDGESAFAATLISSPDFVQFVDISTDQGLMTMDSGTVSLLAVVIPEPASAMLVLLVSGVAMAVNRGRRSSMRR
ncbi:MAG: hypothetical protein WC708_12855 [Lentisphaeria bacterium]